MIVGVRFRMADLLNAIFGLCLFDRLPLPILGSIGATVFQGANVVDDVARTCAGWSSGGWTRILPFESRPGRRASFDSAGRRPLTGSAVTRRVTLIPALRPCFGRSFRFRC